jgi:hypothetical protein
MDVMVQSLSGYCFKTLTQNPKVKSLTEPHSGASIPVIMYPQIMYPQGAEFSEKGNLKVISLRRLHCDDLVLANYT